ncbi:hypothetical protein K413DRAFT_4909 [Clostridium sp. ASBs410]|nr:hypothetical protein K413DRAFT_4909 [Clostridium sp. ASBs410]
MTGIRSLLNIIFRGVKLKYTSQIYEISIKLRILQLYYGYVIFALKDVGYSTYRLKKEKLFSEATIQKFRNNEPVSWDNISTVC